MRGHLGGGRAQRLHLGAAGAERDDVAGEVEALAIAQADRQLELAELGADAAPHLGHQPPLHRVVARQPLERVDLRLDRRDGGAVRREVLRTGR